LSIQVARLALISVARDADGQPLVRAEVFMSQRLVDFSSFSPEQEALFVPFEAAMRANARRAGTISATVAGGLLVVLLVVCVGLYTPCNAFCARPPGPCKTAAQISAWRAGCESSCRALEHASGLTVDKESKVGEGERRVVQAAIGGTEFVQTLNACAFSGSTGVTCSSVVKNALSHGLWCEEGK
jgi:hypothetical protein